MRNCKAFDYIREVRDYALKNGINASFQLHIEKSHLLRIGNSSVSLNTSEHLCRLNIEVVNDKRIGNHTQMGTVSSFEYVKNALDIALEKANFAFEKNYKPILQGPEENICKSNQYDTELENLDSAHKINIFKEIIEKTGSNYNYSGSWSSGSVEIFMISTKNNYEAWQIGTDQQFIMVLQEPKQKWELKSAMSGWRLKDITAEECINYFKSLLPVYLNNTPYKVEPGEYTVAFGPGALAELVFMWSDIGLNGQANEEKQSWLCNNKLNDKVSNEKVTLIDDPENENVFGIAFDDAGFKRNKYPLIEKGLLKGFMYDINTAAKFNKPQTGHSLMYINNVVFSTGNDDEDILKAVKDLDKVIFIPDIHYVGIPSPAKGIITGSSRYNAVLIEKGKMVAPLFSCRITEKVSKIFNNIIKISKKAVSFNNSNTYERRSPFALGLPSYIVSEKVNITDSSDSF